MTMRGHGGYTLAEALIALAVAGLLVIGLAIVLGVVGRAARRHADTVAAAETERTVGAVLGPELRALTRADATFDGDSVRLRAFRGSGTLCTWDGRAALVVYGGVRQPEAGKDSVLLVWEDGEAAFDLEGVARSAECGGSLRLELAGVTRPQAPLLALVFETGAYSISGAAFRYRRGNAGRQPLTEENLAGGSGLVLATRGQGSAAARATLQPVGTRRASGTVWSLSMPQFGATAAP